MDVKFSKKGDGHGNETTGIQTGRRRFAAPLMKEPDPRELGKLRDEIDRADAELVFLLKKFSDGTRKNGRGTPVRNAELQLKAIERAKKSALELRINEATFAEVFTSINEIFGAVPRNGSDGTEKIEAQIMQALYERANTAKEVKKAKDALGLPMRDEAREQQVLDNIRKKAGEGGLNPEKAALVGPIIIQFFICEETVVESPKR
ncbi:Chorismate mutase type II [uncultured archaeon]|nr:Chorismate mutase type II [uncultured archaeon]